MYSQHKTERFSSTNKDHNNKIIINVHGDTDNRVIDIL